MGSPGARFLPPSARRSRVPAGQPSYVGIMVNFWTSWCLPCEEEPPILEPFSRQDREKVSFYLFRMAEPVDTVREACRWRGFLLVPAQVQQAGLLPVSGGRLRRNPWGQPQRNPAGALAGHSDHRRYTPLLRGNRPVAPGGCRQPVPGRPGLEGFQVMALDAEFTTRSGKHALALRCRRRPPRR